MNGRNLSVIVLILFLLCGIIFFAVIATPTAIRHSKTIIAIPAGATLEEIAGQLAEQGIIAHSGRFAFAARLLGQGRHLRAGRFSLKRVANYYDLVMTLTKWEVVTLRVTIPEGYHLRQIAHLLTMKIGVDSTAFMRRALDPTLARELEIPALSVEGYLFPDSYDFLEGDTPDYIIRRMVSRFREVVFSKIPETAHTNKQILHKHVTMASIVEGECRVDEERPVVASLYYNRLRKRIRLEADPTIQYLLPGGPKRLVRSDLSLKSPYNTYQHQGLPPGPINNPGLKSILAAVYPARTRYLYMVANGDSTHTFTDNYEDFLIAKRKLQLLRRQRLQKLS